VVRGQRHAPAAFYPQERPLYPLYRRLGGPQGRSAQVRKILPPPRFDPRTDQPVANCYTDWATRPTCEIVTLSKYKVSIPYSQFALTVILRTGTCHDPHTKSTLLTPDCMSVVHNFIHPIVPTASPMQQNTSRVLELKWYAASVHSSGTYLCVDRLHVSLPLKVCLFYVKIWK
jgi:hypothetical protein